MPANGTLARPLLGLRLRFVAGQLQADPELARSVCIVRYEDLCSDSLPTIDAFSEHTGLEPSPFAQAREAYSKKLSFPDYYKPVFSAQELAEITSVIRRHRAYFGYGRRYDRPRASGGAHLIGLARRRSGLLAGPRSPAAVLERPAAATALRNPSGTSSSSRSST